MTALTDRPDETAEELARARKRDRFLIATVVVLAVALLGVGAWVIYDLATVSDTANSDTAIPAEVEQVLNDYNSAWEQNDANAFRTLVTDDYILSLSFYVEDGMSETYADRFSQSASDAARDVEFGREWRIEQFGEPIATGDGPWFITVGQNWVGLENGQDIFLDDGTASYAIVEVDGTLKVANHTWVGHRSMAEE